MRKRGGDAEPGETRPLLQRPGEEQVFTKDALKERRAKFNRERKEKADTKKKTLKEQAAELKAQAILGVSTLVVGLAILWWLDGRPSF